MEALVLIALASFAAGVAVARWLAANRGGGRGSMRAALRLDGALRRGELVVHFQPKVACATGRATGAEALVRWQHPARGLLLPGAFLADVACRRTLERLTDHVLRVALARSRRWRATGLDLDVSVNVPPGVLLERSFPARLAGLLEETGARAGWLTIELTEGSIEASPALARMILGDLHELGVRLSIDDYGVGSASLERLRALPFDELKIDRSFVAAIGHSEADALIVRAVIAVGRVLRRHVVAEGVESVELAGRLAGMGCDEVQGFVHSPALPPDRLEAWILDAPGPTLVT